MIYVCVYLYIGVNKDILLYGSKNVNFRFKLYYFEI